MSNLMTEPQGPPIQAPPKRRWYLRPWFIIPAALVVVAAAVITVLVSLPQTITVRGIVVDRLRPDLAVAAATLKADGTTGKTDATGAFTMTGVPQNAKLQVSARYYGTITVTASSTKMTIRLAPIPVGVTVTSAMTGNPVKATITAPPGEPQPYTMASGSTVRLYRAEPSETLTVTANGYRPAHSAVSPGRVLTVALEPSRQTLWRQLGTWYSHGKYRLMADWLLRPATGYTFILPTAQEQAAANKTVQPEWEVYATARGIGGTTAWVFLTIDKPGARVDYRQYAEKVVGHAARLTIAGRPAWHGGPSSRTGYYGTMMQVRGFLLEVYGASAAQTDQIMTKIVTTLLGPDTATPHSQAPASSMGWTVPDPALAGMFPAVPGFGWAQMSAADREQALKAHFSDLGNRVQGADIRYATSGGSKVAIVSVLALAPAYASPKAAAAELTRLSERAAEAWGQSFEGNISGHRVMMFISHGMYNWYWVSGKTIVSVSARNGDARGDKLVNLYTARTP